MLELDLDAEQRLLCGHGGEPPALGGSAAAGSGEAGEDGKGGSPRRRIQAGPRPPRLVRTARAVRG